MIRIEFLSLEQMRERKEEVWPVCRQIFEMMEEYYYHRLEIFKEFALFYDQEKIIGFLSFNVDKLELDGKKILLIGVGHGTVLPEYRSKSLIQKASWKFLWRKIWSNPFRRIVIWGIAITHLSFRMGMRASKYRYPNKDEKTPEFYRKLLDFLGNKYYSDSYNPDNYTGAVKYYVKDPAAIATEEEMKDPMVAEFIRLVPSALMPENKTGVFYVFPLYRNIMFWIRRMIKKSFLTLFKKNG